jgi:hypothetical protein
VSPATIDRDGVLVIKQLNPKRDGVTLRIDERFNEANLIRTMTYDGRYPATIDESFRVYGPDVKLQNPQFERVARTHMIAHLSVCECTSSRMLPACAVTAQQPGSAPFLRSLVMLLHHHFAPARI